MSYDGEREKREKSFPRTGSATKGTAGRMLRKRPQISSVLQRASTMIPCATRARHSAMTLALSTPILRSKRPLNKVVNSAFMSPVTRNMKNVNIHLFILVNLHGLGR